jgi:hypothetical protein
MLDSFFCNAAQLPLETSAFQQIPHFHLITSIKHICFYLAFWAQFAFWEADFHKMKGWETLRSQNGLNTTDDDEGPTELLHFR